MSDRTAILTRIRALRAKTVANGCTKHEAAAARAKARAMMAAREVSDAELVEEEREPNFDADLKAYYAEEQAYYAARAAENVKPTAEVYEGWQADEARRERRDRWSVALICTGIFIGLFAASFAFWMQHGSSAPEAFLKAFRGVLVLAGLAAAIFGLPVALLGGYFIIKNRFGPETAAASAAILTALTGALTGALYPTNTLAFFTFLSGLALLVATSLLILGVPLHLMGWFNGKPKAWCTKPHGVSSSPVASPLSSRVP